MAPRCQLLSGSLPPTFRLLGGRSFSTSTPLLGRKGGDLGNHLPRHVIPRDANIPPYPHGSNLLYRQSNRGLYGGQMIQFGNNVSPKTETKTRRCWKPNVITKGFYSIALKKKIKLRVTSTVLRTMDREGGLDEYLLKESPTRIKELGPVGWALRWTLMQQPMVIARFRAEAAALGLAQEIIDERWPKTSPVRQETARLKAERLLREKAKLEQKQKAMKKRAEQLARNHNSRLLLDRFATRYRREGVAPDRATAWALANDEFTKNKLEIRLAGNVHDWEAWKKAHSTGAIDANSSDEKWFAQHQARKVLDKELNRRPQYQKKGLTEHEVSRKAKEESKDEWARLVNGRNVTETRENR